MPWITVTAYCACHLCCGPQACGLTASGTTPVEGHTIAAPRRVPFGTRIFLQGIGWRTVEDRLSRRYDNRFDLYMVSHRRAARFGKRQVWVQIRPSL